MWARLSIVAGLVVGVVVAAVVLGGIVAFAPVAPLPSIAVPSLGLASPLPSASAEASATPSAVPSGSAAASGGAFHIREAAPPLQVPQVGGGTIDLANLKGKPVWINFMATWCPSCQDEFPLMNGFAARYAANGLVIIAVDVREDEGAVASFAKQLNTTFPLGLDADGKAATTWDALALPVHFWVGVDGIIRDGALGGIGPDIMAEGLKTILPGVDVKP
ncbi:MAG TPA: TlpA disulfide reductase family protein [Candidatus Limnocylindrales bacterium]